MRDEEELKQSAREWAVTFDSVKDLIMVIDRDHKIIRANQAVSAFLNLPQQEIIGKSCCQLFHNTQESSAICPLKKVKESKKREQAEMYLSEKDIWIEVLIDPILDERREVKEAVHIIRDITGRKKIEDLLKESEENYRTIFNAANDAIFIHDLNSRAILDVNQKMCQMYGYTLDETLELSVGDLSEGKPPYSQKEAAELISKVVKGEPQLFEWRAKDKAGRIFWVEVNLKVILINEEKKVMAVVRDITERKKAEEALRESENKYRFLFDVIPVAVGIGALDGRLLAANHGLEELTGYTREELGTFEDVSEMYVDRGQRKQLIELLQKEGKVRNFEAALKRKDGTVYYALMNVDFIKLGGEQVILNTLRDITERKRAEEELIKEKEITQRYIDIAGVIMIVIDTQEKVSLINETGCRILGYKKEEIVGKNWFDNFIPEEQRNEIKDLSNRMLKGEIETNEYYENRVLTKDGEKLIAWRGIVLKDEKGAIIGHLSSGEDITERKKIEQSLMERERFFSGTLNDMHTFVAVLKPDGEIIFVNNTPLDIAGLKLEGIKEKKFYDISWWTYSDESVQAIRKDIELCASGASNSREIQVQTLKGFIWIEFSIHPIYDESGKVKYIVPEGRDITERKKTEEALKNSENMFKGIASASPVGLGIAANRSIQWVNDPLLQLIGRQKEEIIGHDSRIFYADDEGYNLVGNKFYAELREKASAAIEVNWKHKDGRILNILLTGVTLEQQDLSRGIVFAVMDITERKQAEAALRETRDYLENLINYANAPIIVWDTDFKITRFNRAFERLTGYPISEVIGQKLSMFFPEAMRDESMDKIKLTAGGEYWESMEIPILCKDGNIRLVLWNSANIYTKDRKILLATIAQGVDITERKKSTGALVESEKKFRTIVENITDVFLAINFNGIILDVNENASNMLGYKREELVGAHLTLIDREKNRAVLMAALAQVIQHRTDLFEREFATKEGVLIPVVISSKVISEQAGGILNAFARDITERKNAEMSLRSSEENFRIITENSLVGIYIIRRERFSYVNPAMAETFGYAAAEITEQREVLDLVYPDDRNLVLNRLLELSGENKEVEHFAFRGLRKDRSVIYCDILGRYVSYRGQPAIIGTILDVTERKLVEDKLAELETLKSSVLDAIPHAVLGLRNRKIIFANSSVNAVFGWKPDELVGQDVRVIYRNQKDYEVIGGLIYSILTEKEKSDMSLNFYCRRKDGKDILCRITASRIGDSLKEKEIVTVYEDITATRMIEETLNKVSSAMEQIADSVIITNRQGIIEYVNHGFEKATGYSKEEVIGKKPAILKMRRVETSSYKDLWDAILSGSIFTTEFINSKKDGRQYSTEKTIWPIKDEKGNVTHFVSIDRDITGRRELEKSQRFLQLGKLVGNMAHEVNNPLMVISGRAQLSLMEEIANEDLKKNLQLIFAECQRAKDIIQRMLKFSRPSKGQLKEVDINKCLEELISLVEHQFTLESITIKRDYGGSLPFLMVDDKQIQEVFMNLLNNSHEAMSEGGAIEIKTYLEGDSIRIDFKDPGSGMSQEVLAKVFEPFFTTKEKGTGLGLSVSYSIVKNYGGDLKFTSSPGKGTTASIFLPLKKGDDNG